MGSGSGPIGRGNRIDRRFTHDAATAGRAELGLRRLLPGLARRGSSARGAARSTSRPTTCRSSARAGGRHPLRRRLLGQRRRPVVARRARLSPRSPRARRRVDARCRSSTAAARACRASRSATSAAPRSGRRSSRARRPTRRAVASRCSAARSRRCRALLGMRRDAVVASGRARPATAGSGRAASSSQAARSSGKRSMLARSSSEPELEPPLLVADVRAGRSRRRGTEAPQSGTACGSVAEMRMPSLI